MKRNTIVTLVVATILLAGVVTTSAFNYEERTLAIGSGEMFQSNRIQWGDDFSVNMVRSSGYIEWKSFRGVSDTIRIDTFDTTATEYMRGFGYNCALKGRDLPPIDSVAFEPARFRYSWRGTGFYP